MGVLSQGEKKTPGRGVTETERHRQKLGGKETGKEERTGQETSIERVAREDRKRHRQRETGGVVPKKYDRSCSPWGREVFG